VGQGHFAIDHGKVAEDARFDGVFVLRTNTDLNPLAAMLRYKELWTVERIFRTEKRAQYVRDIHGFQPRPERGPIAGIVIPDQVVRRTIPGKGLANLL
jgi:hypothetical protein